VIRFEVEYDSPQDIESPTKMFEQNKSQLIGEKGRAYDHGKYPELLKKMSHKIQSVFKKK
jgi:hypothetical protein